MTIQEVKRKKKRKTERKTKKLNQDGRLLVVEVGENYKQKSIC